MAEFTNCPNCGTLIGEYSNDREDRLYICRDCGQIFCGHCSSHGCPNCGSYNRPRDADIDEINRLKSNGKIVGGRSVYALEEIQRHKEWLKEQERINKMETTMISDNPNANHEIPMGFFMQKKNLKRVKICEGIIKIGASAFNTCTALEQVSLPESLKEIGNSAFFYCPNLEYINIPDGLQKIGESAFAACYKLKTLKIMPTTQVDPKFAWNSEQNKNIVQLIDKTTGQEIILTPPPPKPVQNLYGTSNAGSTYNSQSSGCFSTIFVMCLILSMLIFVW